MPRGGGRVCRLTASGIVSSSREARPLVLSLQPRSFPRLFPDQDFGEKIDRITGHLSEDTSVGCLYRWKVGGLLMGWCPGDSLPPPPPAGTRRGTGEHESTRQKPRVGGQLMLFIYTTRVTSRMMRYKYWTPVKWSRPSGEDTAVGANPPTQNETRMRKPRTESPTPLRKGKDPGKVQTIKRERMRCYRGDGSLPPAWRPQEPEMGVGGDGNTSPPRFLRQTVRSSWVNRVNPPLIQTHDSMFVILINWKIAPPLWSTHTKKIGKKKNNHKQKMSAFFFRQ